MTWQGAAILIPFCLLVALATLLNPAIGQLSGGVQITRNADDLRLMAELQQEKDRIAKLSASAQNQLQPSVAATETALTDYFSARDEYVSANEACKTPQNPTNQQQKCADAKLKGDIATQAFKNYQAKFDKLRQQVAAAQQNSSPQQNAPQAPQAQTPRMDQPRPGYAIPATVRDFFLRGKAEATKQLGPNNVPTALTPLTDPDGHLTTAGHHVTVGFVSLTTCRGWTVSVYIGLNQQLQPYVGMHSQPGGNAAGGVPVISEDFKDLTAAINAVRRKMNKSLIFGSAYLTPAMQHAGGSLHSIWALGMREQTQQGASQYMVDAQTLQVLEEKDLSLYAGMTPKIQPCPAKPQVVEEACACEEEACARLSKNDQTVRSRQWLVTLHTADPRALAVRDLNADRKALDAYKATFPDLSVEYKYDSTSQRDVPYRVSILGGAIIITAPGTQQSSEGNWRFFLCKQLQYLKTIKMRCKVGDTLLRKIETAHQRTRHHVEIVFEFDRSHTEPQIDAANLSYFLGQPIALPFVGPISTWSSASRGTRDKMYQFDDQKQEVSSFDWNFVQPNFRGQGASAIIHIDAVWQASNPAALGPQELPLFHELLHGYRIVNHMTDYFPLANRNPYETVEEQKVEGDPAMPTSQILAEDPSPYTTRITENEYRKCIPGAPLRKGHGREYYWTR